MDTVLNMLFAKLFIENTNIHNWEIKFTHTLEIVLECLLKFQSIALSAISPSKQTEIQCNGTHELT